MKRHRGFVSAALLTVVAIFAPDVVAAARTQGAVELAAAVRVLVADPVAAVGAVVALLAAGHLPVTAHRRAHAR